MTKNKKRHYSLKKTNKRGKEKRKPEKSALCSWVLILTMDPTQKSNMSERHLTK